MRRDRGPNAASTPTALVERGSLIGVVAPGFAVQPRFLRDGLARLQAMGFTARVGRHVLSQDGYLAGSDAERAADLSEMFRDRSVRAVWFARGGYGTARILDDIDWAAYRRDPKPLIGYSDATALFAAASRQARGIALYGPVITELGDPTSYATGSLRRALAGLPQTLRLRPKQVLAAGRATGTLAGGNLAVLCHLCGTRSFPALRGKVLFLEEVGEPTYRVDRMLTQLAQAGALNGVAGVLVGHLGIPARRRFPPDRDVREVLAERLVALGVPVVVGLPSGHVPHKRTLPLGAAARIDTQALEVTFPCNESAR